jgi:uncharacterized protein YbbC (DUF1343 family)/CubicO group peptidase (beta-lactamase class C family)
LALPAICVLLAMPANEARAQSVRTSPESRAGTAAARPLAAAAAAFDAARLALIDSVVADAIGAKQVAGAVVVVGRRDGVAFQKAYGDRALSPAREPMTLDTVFDAASVTKVVATTTSVMKLVEDGRIRLTDRVAAYVPEFGQYGKRDITIRQLLTHTSGLRPDVDLTFPWIGYDEAMRLACEEVPQSAPDAQFVYSDIGFFVLGDIVRRAGGDGLDRFARTRVFGPLGMTDTSFNPPESLRPRIAPSEACPEGDPSCQPGAMLRGVVHDPTARRMGGVAGHAGMFTTAADLATFARMLLGGGQIDGGARVLAPLTVARMTSPATPPGTVSVRGLGWDMDSSYSSNRGELMRPGSFGHTGFTGTSIWVDPESDLFVVFVSSRLHPDGKGDVTPLRARVATIAASALLQTTPAGGHTWGGRALAPSGPISASAGQAPTAPARPGSAVLSGIDVLRAEGFARLKGRRVGLVTNHTGIARDGSTTIDLIHQAKDVTLIALFSPEHGIRGILDADVPSTVDEKTGLPIHSLYGDTRRPTEQMLEGIDTMVIDLQDIGARFYTYTSTMAYVMEEAAKRKIQVVVLDRPNPVNGWQIEGPTIDRAALSFVAYFPMPIRHGMTLGELARLFNEENGIGVDLVVVEAGNWRRDMWFDETGLPWVNPSPNMRNMIQASLYPGIGAIEGSNISVGRGTDTPFEQIGAPWIDGVRLAEHLNARQLAGIRFYPVSFTPASSRYANQPCQGVFMIVTDRRALQAVRVGLEIAAALVKLHGKTFDFEPTEKLFGTRGALAELAAGRAPESIAASWSGDVARWRLLRAKYLIYR